MSLDPKLTLDLIAAAVPRELHANLLVAGSVAAAYHHRDAIGPQGIATKDADVIVQPVGAIDECRSIATRLLDGGWRRTDDCYPKRRDEPARGSAPCSRTMRRWTRLITRPASGSSAVRTSMSPSCG